MKKTLVALTVAAVAFSASASAQHLVLVAGWDFEFTTNSYNTLPTPGVLGANYSDTYNVFPPGINDGPDSAARGTLYLNGTNGSHLWSFFGPLATANKIASSGDADFLIQTRDPGSTQFGQWGGLDSAALGLRNTNATRSDFSFVINTEGLSTLSHIRYRSRTSLADRPVSYDWTVKVGDTVYDLGDPLAVTQPSYSTYNVDLSGINLAGASSITIIGRVHNPVSDSPALLDNFGVYGYTALAAIPEPSTYAGILGILTLGVGFLRRRVTA